MSKLTDWLAGFTVFIALWIGLIQGKFAGFLIRDYPEFVINLPIVPIALFAVYSVTVILYRTFTFTTCEQAAIDLQEEIKEARADLINKGFIFK